ncbi:hypothetical protein MYMA111404_03675 [Mycoplasma marinum]|uniref:Uncharacterized protein n=1 Tax=Mycoplasma marinum TaxID=1937190 RepID=A0A4R0XNS5_9MOLU|nr:hypothetical protein C4B24_03060 [Mycoplasma marinum]
MLNVSVNVECYKTNNIFDKLLIDYCIKDVSQVLWGRQKINAKIYGDEKVYVTSTIGGNYA